MAADPSRPAVVVRGVVNRFGAQLVHDGLDMEVRRGEIFAIVGGSGSGKSVLLRTILGLQRPQAGSVEIGGRDLTRLYGGELRAIKRRYGVTFQSGALFSSLTVAENVGLPISEALALPADALAGLATLKIRLVGLPDDAGAKFPAQLSGGMVKRAALARALALDPELLFLDEPTSGLDPIAAAAFDELLLYLNARYDPAGPDRLPDTEYESLRAALEAAGLKLRVCSGAESLSTGVSNSSPSRAAKIAMP